MLHHVFENLTTDAEVREATDKVSGLIKSGKLKLDQISILDVAESTLGRAGMRKLREVNADDAFVGVQESVNPVNLSAFTNITGNIVTQASLEGYKAPEFIGDMLVTPETATDDGGIDIGLGQIDDDALVVAEGEEFPNVKFGEDFISIPTSVKRGLKIGITRELIFFDKTGKIIEMAQTIGNRLGMNKEKRILRTFLGLDNSFVRKNVALNTYLTTGNRINKKSGLALTDWQTIEAAQLLYANMSDDRVNAEPIMVNPDTMVVMPKNEFKARRILGATELRTVNGSNTTISGNVVNRYNVMTSPLLKSLLVASGITAANADEYWYYGQPKKAFKYRTIFPFQVRTAQNDVDSFERDVVAQFRADERGVPRIVAPWYNAQFYDS